MPAKPAPLRPHEERPNYARRKPIEPPPGEPGLSDSFLIVTEGEVTERLYFESLRAALQIVPVTVRIIHPSCTVAVGLVRAAIQERDWLAEARENDSLPSPNVSAYDHVWVLFDTDVPARQRPSVL